MRASCENPDGSDPEFDDAAHLQDVGVVGLWELDASTGLVRSNVSMARWYGLHPAVAAGGVPTSVYRRAIHPDDVAEADAALRNSLQFHRDYHARYRLRDDNGDWRMITVFGRVQFQNGEFVRITGINRFAEEGGDTDNLNRAALIAGEIVRIFQRGGDEETAYFAKMLLLQIGERLAGRIPRADTG